MEEVWLKAEPIDDKFDACFYGKFKDETNTVASEIHPVPIIKKEEPEAAAEDTLLEECVQSTEYTMSHSQVTSDAKRKLTVEGSGVGGYKEKSSTATSKKLKNDEKSREEIHQQKQLKEVSTAVKVEKKLTRKAGTQKRRFCCEVCGKEFKQSYHLNRHRLLHSGEKPHVCNECGKAFTERSALKSHQLTHTTGERRRFFCEECGGQFATKVYLKIHQRIHQNSGELPFVCDECGDRFNWRKSLARHKLKHTGVKRFECDECGKKFYDSALLQSHQKTHVTGDKPFTCIECGKGFYHKSGLILHKRSSHSVERPFGCDICGKRFTQKGTLTIHKVIHSDVRPYGCDVCGLRFTQMFTLKTHALKQHGRNIPTTLLKRQKQLLPSRPSIIATELESESRNDNISSDDSGSKENFGLKVQPPKDTNEIESSSESSESEDTKLEDTDATKMSSSSLETQSMLEIESVDEKFTPLDRSIECNDRQPDTMKQQPFFDIVKSEPTPTPTNENLSVIDERKEKRIKKQSSVGNAESSSIDRPLSCDKCERKFALIAALKNHQRSHRREESKVNEPSSFICDECGKFFTQKDNLRRHKRVHSDLKPYTCDVCAKSFNQLANCIMHKRTHSGERPFPCDVCGKSFGRKDRLVLHTILHTKARQFGCDLCGKNFSYRNGLRQHINLTHLGKRYGCDVCGKTFSQNGYIKIHLRTHTGHKPFQCDECISKFTSKCDLQRHKRHTHRAVGEPSFYQSQKMKKMMDDAALLQETV